MRNGGRILLAGLKLHIQIKICVATFDTNHPVTDSTQTISRYFNPSTSQFRSQIRSAELAVSGETIRLSISLRLAVYILHVMCIKDTQMLAILYPKRRGTGRTVRGSNPGGDIFSIRLDRSWGPPSLLPNGYRISFPGVKWPGHGADHPLPSRAEVKGKEELRSTPLPGLRDLF